MDIFERKIRLFENKLRGIRNIFNPIEYYYKQYRKILNRIRTFSVFNYIYMVFKQKLDSLYLF
jgi:hypothetical protein